jgi:glycosyltransferase involved in cell wall biosynthesis
MIATMTSGRPRVAIDAHTVGRRATGNETYILGLLQGLTANGAVDPVALVDAEADLPPQLAAGCANLRHRKAIPRLLRELSSARRRWGVHLLHVQYVRPPRSDVPVATTIHDISFEHFPKLFSRRTRLRMRATIPWSARHSAVVLTGSEHARGDLLQAYGLAPERVVVTPYAADRRFGRLDRAETDRLLAGMGLPEGYLLCVGNLQPRKNLRRLVEAFATLPAEIRPPLVVVGQPAWLYDDIYAAVRRRHLGADVHFTGFVSTEQLVALYSRAHAFAYPSLYEGFGLPVLEALACGVPTLTSDRSSLPEVAGDAALLTDPEDVEAIAAGLERVICDEALRGRLAERGPRQAARFSWERCAEVTAQAYQFALESGARS